VPKSAAFVALYRGLAKKSAYRHDNWSVSSPGPIKEFLHMRDYFKIWYQPITSPLSRRIVFYVFVSVIVIEAIILIPSYLRREQELLSQLHDIADAQVNVIMNMAPADLRDRQMLDHLRHLLPSPNIIGGKLYSAAGENLGEFGEPPELSYAEVMNPENMVLQRRNGDRYDAAWLPSRLRSNHTLVLRLDAAQVRRELLAFTGRILGLVVIISIFVTAGALAALYPIVVTPILRLRKDLVNAGDAISSSRKTPEFLSTTFRRHDELGEVITAFRKMYQQISAAISERRAAEAALQKSLDQIAAYSLALNKELERGREMQANFLPAVLPRREGWEFAAFFKPARQVAGDFYDVFLLPDGSLGLVLADVCDKGVGAALFMALFRSLIRIFSGQSSLDGLECRRIAPQRPTQVRAEADTPSFPEALKAVELTNDYIAKNHEALAMFATLFFGVLVPETGELHYVNGGHDPLYVIGPSGAVRDHLGPTGPAVGVQLNAGFQIGQTTLHPGEILFGYTDGVTEARGEDESFFSEKRLLQILKSGATSASLLLERISREVQDHIGNSDQFDDITMLSVRRHT
jgi:sigma-B regulation protein RsbU (phosphoserine phosphatase)